MGSALRKAAILGSKALSKLSRESVVGGTIEANNEPHDAYLALTKLLLSKGANVNNTFGGDPLLYVATLNRSERYVQLLLDEGADVNLTSENGQTPLFAAIRRNEERIVKLLLEKGADVNLTSHNRPTPLYVAVRRRQERIVELLLDKGADVNLTSDNRPIPLYEAVAEGYVKIVQSLLEKGADINVVFDPLKSNGFEWPVRAGGTPLDVAKEQGHEKIVQILLTHGAVSGREEQTRSPRIEKVNSPQNAPTEFKDVNLKDH